MKKNLKDILIFITLIVIFGLNIFRQVILNDDFSYSLILEIFIFTLIYIFNFIKLRKYKFINNFINIILLVFSCLSLLFSSFNALGFLLLYIFILLITLTYMVKTENRFEISMVISVSLLILAVIIVSLLNLLKFTPLFLIIIACCCIIYLCKNKSKLKKIFSNINYTNFIIFSILFIIAILGGVGRYVHKWDEYSYWAYAAKVCIKEDSIYSVISRLGASRGYPPVSTIWHYLVSVFAGYSEPNLYIGLTILTFVYFMPVFIKIKDSKAFTKVIFTVAVIFFPYLLNGSISYSLVYVDLLLGIMCTSALIITDDEKDDKKAIKKLVLLLVMITLLKVNGFVFAFAILLLFYLKDVTSKKISFKNIFKILKKYILPGVFIIFTFIIWKVISEAEITPNLSYEFKLIPSTLETNISSKTDPSFMLNFYNSVLSAIDEDIIFSFINIPLFAYLIIVFGLIYYIEKKETNKNIAQILLPYIISYIAFYLITALSLFVMFSVYEASTLASFGRYLAPINIAYLLYALYKLPSLQKEKNLTLICLIIIGLVGFENITFFVTDIKDRKETIHISQSRQNTFDEINSNTKENAKVFVINQEDIDTIMPLWYARYYCYPRIINSHPESISWKIKTQSNEWDLQDWGLTKSTFEKHLIEYEFEYVYFYSSTKELIDELSSMVDNKEDLKKYKLFKIINNQGNIKLSPVLGN